MKHPAKELGEWLKTHRQRHGVVARVFAGKIELSPAEYAEVELGIGCWVGRKQERLIPQVLSFSLVNRYKFLKMLEKARIAKPLKFENVFTREQLTPVRVHRKGSRPITKADIKTILDAVFTPLKRK